MSSSMLVPLLFCALPLTIVYAVYQVHGARSAAREAELLDTEKRRWDGGLKSWFSNGSILIPGCEMEHHALRACIRDGSPSCWHASLAHLKCVDRVYMHPPPPIR